MSDTYLYELGLSAQPVKVLVILFSCLTIVSGLLFLLFYFLKAVGVYKMSQRCAIEKSWYAFIPFYNAYALGKLACVYRDKNNKRFHNAGKIMLFFYTVTFLLFCVQIISALSGAVDVFFSADAILGEGKKLTLKELSPLFGIGFLNVLVLLSSVLLKICALFSLWKIYSLFSYKNVKLLLVLSVFFGFLVPIFLIAISKNEPVFSYDDRPDSNVGHFNFGV